MAFLDTLHYCLRETNCASYIKSLGFMQDYKILWKEKKQKKQTLPPKKKHSLVIIKEQHNVS